MNHDRPYSTDRGAHRSAGGAPTTEMSRWLGSEYGLDPLAIGIVLGQCVRYDIGNVFDPAYTMVCTVAKRLLRAPISTGMGAWAQG